MQDIITPSLANSLAMLAAFALLVAGVYLLRSGRDRKRGILMLIMAVVLVGNVLIWALPAPA